MDFINLVDAAQIVGCNPATLGSAARGGRLNAKKISNTWLVTREALEEWRHKYWMKGTSVPRDRSQKNVVPTS